MPFLLFSESLFAKCLFYHPGKLTELSFHVHHPGLGLLSVCWARRVRVAAVVVRRRWRKSWNMIVQLLLKIEETCLTVKWHILKSLEFISKINLQYTAVSRIPGVGYVMVGQGVVASIKFIVPIRRGYVTRLDPATTAATHPVAVRPHEAGTKCLAPLAKGRRRHAPRACP